MLESGGPINIRLSILPGRINAGSNTNRYEASTEIQDIDARLAQLQDFLRAAKNGDPLPTL